jgi:hypothetical protein
MEQLPTKRTPGDVAHDVARGLISVIPGAGGALQVFFETFFSAPLEKRKEKWMQELAGALMELQQTVDGLTPEKIAENEAFITIAIQASNIAIRSHQQSKLDALRNAIINSVRFSSIDEDEQMAFIHLIDQFTPSHLRLLGLLNDPQGWITINGCPASGDSFRSVRSLIALCMPDLIVREDTVNNLVRDLQAGGIIEQTLSVGAEIEGSGALEPRTTSYGRRFVYFISAQ